MKEGSVAETAGPDGDTELGQSTELEVRELMVPSRFRMCTALLWDTPQRTQ